MGRSRAIGLALGVVADRLLGDPRRAHPVAGFGRLAGRLEGRCWADDRGRGIVYTTALVGGAALGGTLIEGLARQRPVAHALVTAAATWIVLGGRSLQEEALAVADRLEAADLSGARAQVGRIVGRETAALDESGVARAAVESLAENTADAVVAPLTWGAVAGIPGLLGYRAANTLDAMVGHRSDRYARFGWASARLDDALNLPGSRLTAALGTLLAPTVGGGREEAWRVWRRDAPGHPSPNAGPAEASFAGALGVTLGGVNVYGGRREDRHRLGEGPEPGPVDIRRAARLAGAVSVAATALCAALARRLDRSS